MYTIMNQSMAQRGASGHRGNSRIDIGGGEYKSHRAPVTGVTGVRGVRAISHTVSVTVYSISNSDLCP